VTGEQSTAINQKIFETNATAKYVYAASSVVLRFAANRSLLTAY